MSVRSVSYSSVYVSGWFSLYAEVCDWSSRYAGVYGGCTVNTVDELPASSITSEWSSRGRAVNDTSMCNQCTTRMTV